MLVLLSGNEREEIIRGEICDTADDIVVLEKGDDVLFGVIDIEEKNPEYKLYPIKSHDILRKNFASEKKEVNAASWERLSLKLSGANKKAAMAAAYKWRGYSHTETRHCLDPCAPQSNAVQYISKLRKIAQKLADEYGLEMPAWRT